MTFLNDPRPECFKKMSFTKPDVDQPMLTCGLSVITMNGDGDPINPVTYIVFAFGTAENPEEQCFDLPPNMARILASRLVEFADAAERT